MKRVVVALVLLTLIGGVAVWAGSTTVSRATNGQLHNCPQAGNWSIATWDGADGTSTDEAVATCGEGSIDVLYWLDSDSQQWTRYVSGRPEVSSLDSVNDHQGVLALGSATAPSTSPTPTETQPPGSAQTPDGYSFAFPSAYWESDTFRGTVTTIDTPLDVIPASSYRDSVSAPPGSTFALVFLSVENIGASPADVGVFSFRLRDTQNRVFTMDYPDHLTAQWAAEGYLSEAMGYDVYGLYETIQPGVTVDSVFVFLVPDGTTGLVPERCPDDGCSSTSVGASAATNGQLHNCPPAGNWSIATWDGADGTSTDEAVATCGQGSIDVLYWLDSDSQQWKRYVSGRPEVSSLDSVNDHQGILALGSITEGTPTATVTPTPTATAPAYGELPAPQKTGSVAAGGEAQVTISNNAPHALTIEVEGPVSQSFTIPKCEECTTYMISPIFCPEKGPEETFTLPPGEYTVTVRADDPSVTPLQGQWNLEGDQGHFFCYIVIERITFG